MNKYLLIPFGICFALSMLLISCRTNLNNDRILAKYYDVSEIEYFYIYITEDLPEIAGWNNSTWVISKKTFDNSLEKLTKDTISALAEYYPDVAEASHSNNAYGSVFFCVPNNIYSEELVNSINRTMKSTENHAIVIDKNLLNAGGPVSSFELRQDAIYAIFFEGALTVFIYTCQDGNHDDVYDGSIVWWSLKETSAINEASRLKAFYNFSDVYVEPHSSGVVKTPKDYINSSLNIGGYHVRMSWRNELYLAHPDNFPPIHIGIGSYRHEQENIYDLPKMIQFYNWFITGTISQ